MRELDEGRKRVLYVVQDFNGADQVFDDGSSAEEWHELARVIEHMPLYLQASDQAGRIGSPIFDPKGTNAHLTMVTAQLGWQEIPVPNVLRMFGSDWDGGKRSTLAEWQFSNYPFLWNNIIRSEAVYKGQVRLQGLDPVAGLVVVTKSGILPASNSTLYFEQAKAQISAVMAFNTFEIPIRLVGLHIPLDAETLFATWTVYPGRYARNGVTEVREFSVDGVGQSRYGFQPVRFTPL